MTHDRTTKTATILKDGSEGAPVWIADVTGGPTTVKAYEIARTAVYWNETDCHGNAVPAGSYPLEFTGGYVPMSGTANGTPFSGTFGAYPYYVDFTIR